MNTEDASASGYTAATVWCLRCDVGQRGFARDPCWLCGKNDETWWWSWGPTGSPVFQKSSEPRR